MSSTPLHMTFDDTLGAASIGFSLSCVGFGILTTQVFTYFSRYPLDRVAYKLLVVLLWTLELVDQIFIGYSVYYYTVTNFGAPLVLLTGDVIWTLILQLVVGVVVGTIVKICFAMRVWRFSNRNIPVTGLIILLTFGQLGLGIAYTVRAFDLNKLTLASRLKTLATLSLSAGVVTDVITAAALWFFLQRLRTGYKKSDSLVNSLTIYAINTGALTSTMSLCTLILYNVNPTTLHFMASYFILSKLYAISFLCTLNTRKIIRGKGTDRQGGTTSNTANVHSNTFFMSNQPSRLARSASQSMAHHTKSMEVGVVQEVSVVSDAGDIEFSAAHHPYAQNRYLQ